MIKQLTEEHKRNIGLGNSGKKRTEEEKKKLSEIHKSLFKNGFTHPMFGKHHSDESKNKISGSWKELYKNGYISPKGMKSKKHSEETKISLSKNHKSKQEGFIHHFKGKHLTEEHKNKTSSSLKGKMTKNIIFLMEKGKNTRFKKGNENCNGFLVGENLGEKHWNWKGGITPLNHHLRTSSMWKIWREAIFLRDNFTCQNPNCEYCHNQMGVILHPHHIKSFAEYPELRFNINNGITYCAEFHLNSKLLHKAIGKTKW